MTDTPNRRARRAAAATGTAPVEPAIEAATERAAIERDPTAPAEIPAVTAPVLPVERLPDDATAVLPEPTLTAEPDRPAPIVTASPPLAVEPSAVDVVQAAATTDRVATGAEQPGDRDRLQGAAAGQPVLAIEGIPAKTEPFFHYGQGLDVVDPSWPNQGTPGFDVDRNDGPLSLDRMVADLERLSATDPGGMDVIRRRFFGKVAPQPLPAGPTVTVIEVVGPTHGRRRAGMSFGPQARRFLASDLRADEFDALRTDPQLAVGVTEMAVPDAAIAFPDTYPAG